MLATIFVYKKCSTCRKALKWLKHYNILYVERDLITEPPTKKELKAMLLDVRKHGGDGKELFNSSGQVYREMGLAKKIKDGMTEKEAFELLSGNGMLVKRPLLWTDRWVVLGFDEAMYVKVLGPEMIEPDTRTDDDDEYY